jgi:hypothetical protein
MSEWKLVPVEPTDAMVSAACPVGEYVDHFDMKTALRAALAASPAAPAQSMEPVAWRIQMPNGALVAWAETELTRDSYILDGFISRPVYVAQSAGLVDSIASRNSALEEAAKRVENQFGLGTVADDIRSMMLSPASQEDMKIYQSIADNYTAPPAPPALPDDALSSLLPGTYYMDPPDGGSVTILEQLQRMARDAARYRWLRSHAHTDDFIIFSYNDGVSAFALRGSEADHHIDAALTATQSTPGASNEPNLSS